MVSRIDELGTLLRQAREAKGLSLEAVEKELKISRRFLAALEDGDWDKLPGQTYGRAFARSYGRYLGVDVSPLLPIAHPLPTAPSRSPVSPPGKARRPSLALAMAGVALVVLIATVGWIVYANQSAKVPTTLPPTAKKTTTPAPTVPGASTPTVTATGSGILFGWPATLYRVTPGPATIVISFTGPCWVKVLADGTQVAAATYTSGTYTFSANSELQVLFGLPQNATATLSSTPLAIGHGRSPKGIQATVSP